MPGGQALAPRSNSRKSGSTPLTICRRGRCSPRTLVYLHRSQALELAACTRIAWIFGARKK